MTHRIARSFLFTLIALGIGCAQSPPERETERSRAPKGTQARTSLEAAHEAYLDGDWIALGERVRDVLLDAGANETMRTNALELLDKAYEVNAGKLPSGFKLDAGVEKLTFGNIHGMGPDGPHNRVYITGRMRDASHVSEVVVRRLPDRLPDGLPDGFPDEVILQKTTNKGKYQIKHDVPGFEDFNLDAYVPVFPSDGVFSVRVELDDGSATEGWFIGRLLASSSVPEMRSPLGSASFTDKNPLVSWVPFRSPQYLPFERRVVSLWESGTDQTGQDQSWGLWTDEPADLGEVRIGDPSASRYGSSRTELAPGDYSVMVDASESRTFGPVALVRTSRSVEPFHVVR